MALQALRTGNPSKSLSGAPLRPSWVHIACTGRGLKLPRTFRVQEKGSKEGLRQSLRFKRELVGSHACVSTSSSMLRTSASKEKRKGFDLARSKEGGLWSCDAAEVLEVQLHGRSEGHLNAKRLGQVILQSRPLAAAMASKTWRSMVSSFREATQRNLRRSQGYPMISTRYPISICAFSKNLIY